LWTKKEAADAIEAPQDGLGRLPCVAPEASTDHASQRLFLCQLAALRAAARGDMAQGVMLGAEARARPARGAAGDRTAAVRSEREGAAEILAIVELHAAPLRFALVIPALPSYIMRQLECQHHNC